MQTTEKFSNLRQQIDRADQAYYDGGAGAREDIISDDEYDALKRKLKEVAPDDPRHRRVGAPVGRGDGSVRKAEHKIPMGSLDNAMNRPELSSWYDMQRQTHQAYEVIVSAKLDGGSLGLTYSNGVLTQAVTRGDGYVGEEVTANAVMMKGVPLSLSNVDGTPFNGYVRGEVLLPKAAFKKIGSEDSNPRNLGNGMMRRGDGHQCHLLEFKAFRLCDFRGNIPDTTLNQMFQRLDSMGFDTAPIATAASAMGATWAYTNRLHILKQWVEQDGGTHTSEMSEQEIRDRLSYEIDGLVVSVNDVNLLGAMGIKNQRPVGEIALKFPPKAAVTKLNAVEWDLGRTNKLTPVAHLEPVEIGGVQVSKATLCNPAEIKRLGIKIGDQVVVTRQGDVIPKVTGVAETSETSIPIDIPTTCPVSGAPVVRRKIGQKGEESVDIYADVKETETGTPLSVRVKRLEHWTKTVDIKGFGPKTLETLAEAYPDRGPSAIYEWAAGTTDLVPVSPKVQVALRQAVNNATQLTLPQILGGLGIEKLGVRRVEGIITQFPEVFGNLNNWFGDELEKHAVELSLPNVVVKIRAGLAANKAEMKLLAQNGIRVEKFEVVTNPPEGTHVFCLTGKFEEPKKDLHDIISDSGNAFETSFKANVTHVVAADPGSGSSKLKQAEEKGIPILDVAGMKDLLGYD